MVTFDMFIVFAEVFQYESSAEHHYLRLHFMIAQKINGHLTFYNFSAISTKI